MPIFSFDLVPGEWYVRVTCKTCNKKHVLFPDLTKGKKKLKATYGWTCPSCGHRGDYDSEDLESYQHVLPKKHISRKK